VNDNNNDNGKYNNNHTIAQRTGNTTDSTAGGLSASSVLEDANSK
jgi:hypothetical protein